MKNFLSKLWSLSRTDRVRTLAIDAVSLPSFCRVNMLKLVSVMAILLTVGVGEIWGDASTETFDFSSGSYNSTDQIITWTGTSCTIVQSKGGSNTAVNSSYTGTNLRWYASHDVTFTPKSNITITSIVLVGAKSGSNKYYGQTMTEQSSTSATISNTTTTTTTVTGSWTPSTALTLRMGTQFRLTSVTITYCKTPSATSNGTITSSSAVLNWTDAAETNDYQLYWSTSPTPPTSSTVPSVSSGVTSTTYTISSGLTASTTYYWWVRSACSETSKSSWKAGSSFSTTSAASCEANPTIGNASLNGSFNLTTVGVQCASITPGTNCSVASGDYGFIWYERDGTKKEIGGSGVTKVAVTSGAYSSGSFSKDLTGTFVLGTRYSVRAFATNGKPATVYSDTITFQPRSVTFNLNGHGSSTPTTQYVNNGGKATDPSYSESVTGYTFGGWYKEAGCSNSWTFGTDVVSGANKTLYAKWTAKTYTIDLDQDLTPTSAGTTSITATYNSNSNLTSAITPPTKTGWTFAGYYTEKNGSGTQIIDADGNVIASVATYTDASKNWIKAGGVTLYAKWTCTVTWSVSGATNVYSAQTVTYNSSGCKVASVPSGSDLDLENDYCGDKFMGWTSDENYVHGTSNLFTNVAGSPNITGDVTFYAVFADYAD